jgi:16S rRNA (guanine527-N7)-methyltransferase
MLALKGSSAEEEISRDSSEITKFGGTTPIISQCGVGLIEPPATVVIIQRRHPKQHTAKRSKGTKPARQR